MLVETKFHECFLSLTETGIFTEEFLGKIFFQIGVWQCIHKIISSSEKVKAEVKTDIFLLCDNHDRDYSLSLEQAMLRESVELFVL